MNDTLQQQIAAAAGLLNDTMFAALATVNADGTPHNTPLFFMHDEDLSHVYWGSRTDTLHSANIERTGRMYMVVYDSVKYMRGGLYITGIEARRLMGTELDEGIRVQNANRAKFNKDPLPRSYYENNSQALYRASVEKIEIHVVNRDQEGRVASEVHHTVSPHELLQSVHDSGVDTWLV
jgi:hypothetical protein